MAKRGLFVYGTLHPDRAPRQLQHVVAQFQRIGRGTITGQLLDLGEYPGVITHGRQNVVEGTLFALPDDPSLWRELDAYEGFEPSDIPASLFRREQITVTMDDGSEQEHWIYLYNQPIRA